MPKKVAILFLAAIIIFGGVLRFYRIKSLATFRSDQAIELSGASDILRGKLTLIGIKTSISEVRNGAVMYYLLAPVLALSHFDPVAGGILQTVLQLAGAGILYLLVRQFFPEKLALFAAFLVAVSPLLVKFSRQTLLAFYPFIFCCLALYMAVKIIQKPNQRVELLFGLLLGIALQVHYAVLAAILFAIALPQFFLPGRREKIRYYIFLSIGFLIGFSPMIFFEIRHQFFNSHMLLNYLTKSGSLTAGPGITEIIYFIVQGFGSYLWPVLLLPLVMVTKLKKLSLLEKVSLLQVACLLVFVLLVVREKNPHYLLPAIPGLIVLVAVQLERFSARVIILIALIFLVISWPNYGLNDNHGWTMTNGWTVNGIEKSAKIIFDASKTSNFNVAMIVDQENQGKPLRYFLKTWGKDPLPDDAYDRAGELYVVVEPGTELAKVNLWEVQSFGKYQIDRTWPIQNNFLLYKLVKTNPPE